MLYEVLFSTIGALLGKEANAVVLGPANCGKTFLVSGMHRSCCLEQEAYENTSVNFELLPGNAKTEDLFLTNGAVMEHGTPGISATDKITSYELTFKIQVPGILGMPNIYKQRFLFPDGPGGAVFSDEIRLVESPMWNQIKGADTLILCVDTQDPRSTLAYSRFIQQLMFLRDVTWKRVIFLATKADAVFDNESDCLRADAGLAITNFIGRNQIMQLRRKCDYLVAGWTGFYGFQPNGASNFRKDNGTLAISLRNGSNPAEVVRFWRPFNLLDPILYIAAGEAYGLAPL